MTNHAPCHPVQDMLQKKEIFSITSSEMSNKVQLFPVLQGLQVEVEEDIKNIYNDIRVPDNRTCRSHASSHDWFVYSIDIYHNFDLLLSYPTAGDDLEAYLREHGLLSADEMQRERVKRQKVAVKKAKGPRRKGQRNPIHFTNIHMGSDWLEKLPVNK